MHIEAQLQAVRSRYEEVGRQLQDPAAVADQARYRKLMKEYKDLTPLAETYDAYAAAGAALREAQDLLEEGGLDPELRELAQAQWNENKEQVRRWRSS